MGRITDVLSGPTPLSLAGRDYLGRELRIADLAALESFALGLAPDLLADLDGPAAGEDRPSYRARLRAGYDLADSDSFGWGSPECDAAILGTAAGRALFLQAVLRDHRDTMAADQVLELAVSLSAEEWADVERVAFGPPDPLELIERLIDREIGVTFPRGSNGGGGIPWDVAIIEVCTMLHLTPAAVGALTLSEFRTVRAGGRPSRDQEIPDGIPFADFDETVMKPRREFWAEASTDGK